MADYFCPHCHLQISAGAALSDRSHGHGLSDAAGRDAADDAPRRVTEQGTGSTTGSAVHGICPNCGHAVICNSPDSNRTNFEIADLLFAITLLAVSLSIARVAFWTGIASFFIAGLSVWRALLMSHERRRCGYRVSFRDKLALWGASLLGVFIGVAVFVAATMLGGLVLGISFVGIAGNQPANIVVLILGIQLVALTLLFALVHSGRNDVFLLFGAASGLTAGTCLLLLSAALTPAVSQMLLVLPLVLLGAGTICLASQRGGAVSAKSFFVGYLVALSLLGCIGFYLVSSRSAVLVALILARGGLLAWPAVLGINMVEAMWRWDDHPTESAVNVSPHRGDTKL